MTIYDKLMIWLMTLWFRWKRRNETPQQKQEHLRQASAELRAMFADEPADKSVHKIFELLDEIDQSYVDFEDLEEKDKNHGQ